MIEAGDPFAQRKLPTVSQTSISTPVPGSKVAKAKRQPTILSMFKQVPAKKSKVETDNSTSSDEEPATGSIAEANGTSYMFNKLAFLWDSAVITERGRGRAFPRSPLPSVSN